MKYYYKITALREIDRRTDTEVSASFVHKSGTLTDADALRIAKRDELLDQSDRIARVDCCCYQG